MGKVNGMYQAYAGQISPSVSREHIWKLPAQVDALAFSGLVLTQVGHNCGVRAPIEVGEGAVVIGDGMVGQWAAQTLAWRGANVVLVGRHDYRLKLFGPDVMRHTINARQTDWVQAVRDLLPERIRVAVDTVGSIDALTTLQPIMAKFGHKVSAGFMGVDDLLSLQLMRDGELSLDFVSGWTRPRMDHTRELIAAGYLQTLPLITHRFPAARPRRCLGADRIQASRCAGVILDW